MTKDQLYKRLVSISGSAIKTKVGPISAARREANQVNYEESDASKQFNSFFDFEDDLNQIESARKQVERLEESKIIEKQSVAQQSEVIIFDEEDSDLIINDEDGEIIEKKIVEEVEIRHELVKPTVEELKQIKKEIKKAELKLCMHIKANNERCKRQAPNDSDYCKVHR